MKINGKPDGGGGGGVITGLSVTSNGTYIAGAGVDGYSPVEVDVQPELQSKSTSENGTITPDEGYYGLSAVNVNVQPSLQDKTISVNGSYTADEGYYGLSTVTVNVPGPVTSTLNVSVNNTYYPGQGVDGFSQVVVDVPQSVTGFTEAQVTEKTYNIVNLNNSASNVASYAFMGEFGMKTVTLNNCTKVNKYAFTYTGIGVPRGLETVSLPVCTLIDNYAFQNNTSLTSVYAPMLQIVGSGAFSSCYNLSQVSFPMCTAIYTSVFNNCYALESVYLPMCNILDKSVFAGCHSLNQVYLPKVSKVGEYAFYNCSSLSQISIPECYEIGNNVFDGCISLNSVYISNCYEIGSCAFLRCSSLTYLSVNTLSLYQSTFDNCTNLQSVYVDCLSVNSSQFNNCSSLKKINMPICCMSGYWAAFCASNLNELSYGTEIYTVPRFISFRYYGVASDFVINVDAEVWDRWISHSQWGQYSSYFSSFVSTNSDPLLSVSDGVLYGRTGALIIAANLYWYNYVSVPTSEITTVNLPNCRAFYNTPFNDMSTLTSATLGGLKYTDTMIFQSCRNLNYVNLPVCEMLSGRIFSNFSQGSLILGASKVCTVIGNSVFNYGIPSSIYVPALLVDAYKTAYYWSQYSSRIFPIPE